MSVDPVALVAAAKPAIYWSDQPDAPEPSPPLTADVDADLCIVGGGFTGLWTAVQALEESPGRTVVLLEAQETGFGASSRNGGFCEASLTHGFYNGLTHWPDEIATIERLGYENLDGLLATLERHGIDAHQRRTNLISFAVADWQVDDLAEGAALLSEHGVAHQLLDAEQAQASVHSPTYLGGLVDLDSTALVQPARLVWGLRTIAESLGATLHDHSPVTAIEADGNRLTVSTERARVSADRVVVATNAYARPVRQMRRYIVPIYDHVLMTEPLSSTQLAEIGWDGNEALADSGNQFHYYRRTADDRILWGGYDANYYYGNGIGPKYEDRISSHELIAKHFFETFPQLEGLGFTHRWAGPIGTTTKFAVTFGTAHSNRLAWAAGYTGLGVGASRFGARVALDLIDGRETERTALKMVRKKPMPFPPEPLRSAAIQTTRRAIAKADRTGQDGLLLRLLARAGVGFDS